MVSSNSFLKTWKQATSFRSKRRISKIPGENNVKQKVWGIVRVFVKITINICLRDFIFKIEKNKVWLDR
jgi:hypothetical protein